MDESPVCDYSNERYCGTVYYAVQGSSNFLWGPVKPHQRMILLLNVIGQYVQYIFTNLLLFATVVLFIMLNKVVLPFKSVDETLVFDNSNESY